MKYLFLLLLIGMLALSSFASTAREAKVIADSAAGTVASDCQLKMVISDDTYISPGSFSNWAFIYFSTTLDTAIQVFVMGNFPILLYMSPDQFETMPTVPNNFINSPVPYNIALNNGGSAFLISYPMAFRMMFISVHPSLSQQSAWYVRYSSVPNALLITMDIYTGEFMSATDVAENGADLPTQFALEPCYPNPFNATTTLRFELSQRRDVTLAIYDSNGRLVTTLVQGSQEAGRYTIQWNAVAFPSGVYFAQLQSGQQIKVERIVLMK